MADLPAFDEFYAATHRGRRPFPWQHRLAALVATNGWPDEIGVPTGLGKTACLDIAVWALAAQADRPPNERTAPTRTWYVVNRRLLVDAAYDHGQDLSRWLAAPRSLRDDWPGAEDRHIEIIGTVAAALRRIVALESDQGPLHMTRLRGGADLGARPPEPSQPALVFATVPMFASRWLFRGYGSSASIRPVDAALAGTDCLVLLDEAHLARPLGRLAAADGPLAQCDIGDPTLLLPAERARLRLVALTATGEARGHRFDLDDDDLAHPEVQKRLGAAKRTALRPSTRRAVVADLVSAAIGILEDAARPTSCLVFANTPGTARAVFEQARTAAVSRRLDLDCHLLTGRLREREASGVRAAVLDTRFGVPSGRDREIARARHLLIVATQTLEVGADIDVDHLVTETAGVRSMVQRFGRLNRLGDQPASTAVIVHPTDEDDRPVYGTEPTEVWRRLHAAAHDGQVELGPARIADVLGEPCDEPNATGEVLPHHLWDWAKTSVARAPIAAPDLFYEGVDDRRRVAVVWRAYVPGLPVLADVSTIPGALAGLRRLVPPIRGDEAIDLPLRELQQALDARHMTEVDRLRSDGVTLETVKPGRLRPGDQVVLQTAVGLYDTHGWAPDAAGRVIDRSLLRAGLALTPHAIQALFAVPSSAPGDEHEGGTDTQPVDRSPGWHELTGLLAGLQPAGDNADLDERDDQLTHDLGALADLLAAWGTPGDLTTGEARDWDHWWQLLGAQLRLGATCLSSLDDGTPFVKVDLPRRRLVAPRVCSDAFDELSFVEVRSPMLDDHLRAVGETAALIAEHLGLPSDLVEVVREAGATHDLGKHEPRFQRWLSPDPASNDAERGPLAKSATPWHRLEMTRAQAGWPRGGRHELLSARLLIDALATDAPYRDLLVHLVIAHHGHGRPWVGVAHDAAPTKVRALVRGEPVVVSGDLSLPDWDQPARFHRLCTTYGYWGLALLETIVRQADHAASAQAGVFAGDLEVV